MADERLERLRSLLNLEIEKGNWTNSRVLRISRMLDASILGYYRKAKKENLEPVSGHFQKCK